MGKEQLAVRVEDGNVYLYTNDTGENIITYLATISVYAISEMGADAKTEKALRKMLCDMIMSAPTNED